MATEVIVTDKFEHWWDALDVEEQKSVAVIVTLLEERGQGFHSPTVPASLARPSYGSFDSSTAASHPVLYAFDPKRNAILLIGGNKSRNNCRYDINVPKAEKLFAAYLKENK